MAGEGSGQLSHGNPAFFVACPAAGLPRMNGLPGRITLTDWFAETAGKMFSIIEERFYPKREGIGLPIPLRIDRDIKKRVLSLG
jgi:hypothetical protein